MAAITTKRVYDPVSPEDGCRILVDRLWPRGLTKEEAAIYYWAKTVAPSTELRQWLHSDWSRWPEFRSRYEAELRSLKDELLQVLQRCEDQPITLLYSAKDRDLNHALILKDVLAVLKKQS